MKDVYAFNKTSCGFLTDVGYTRTIKMCLLTVKKLQGFLTIHSRAILELALALLEEMTLPRLRLAYFEIKKKMNPLKCLTMISDLPVSQSVTFL
jgi:hypothetical protein